MKNSLFEELCIFLFQNAVSWAIDKKMKIWTVTSVRHFSHIMELQRLLIGPRDRLSCGRKSCRLSRNLLPWEWCEKLWEFFLFWALSLLGHAKSVINGQLCVSNGNLCPITVLNFVQAMLYVFHWIMKI
jgi:hypothetical protein